MTLQEYLAVLPLDDLKLIASTLGLHPKLVSRARLIREIPIRMFQPGFIESRVDALSREERDVLLAVMFSGDRGYAHDGARPVDPPIVERLYGLLKRGLIMGRREARRTPCYVVPGDIREIMGRHVNKQLAGRLSAAHAPPVSDGTESLSFIRDLFSFLSRLRVEPVRLTDRGVLFKRALDTLANRLEGYASRPARFDLMIRYCRARGLVYEDGSRLCCSPAFEAWRSLPTVEKTDDLLAFWYGALHHQSPRVANLLDVLPFCLDFDGLDVEAVIRLVVLCTAGPSASSHRTHHRLEVLDSLGELEWLGLLRLYGDRDGVPQAFAVTPLGRSVLGGRAWAEEEHWSERFVVQPTYEIIAPRTLHLSIRDRLERCADLIAVDRTLTYRITKDTIYRAGDADMPGGAILAFLRRHSEKGVPQNVEYSIHEWGDSYGQVYFMDIFLLRTADPEIARHIKAHKDLAPFVHGQIAPDALIVERHRRREMMDALRKAGFMPKSHVIGLDPEGAPPAPHFAREPFAEVRTPSNPPHRPAPQVIGIDECLPGYRLHQQLHADDGHLSRLEKTTTMQYLSPKHTRALLELAINREHTVLIDYYFGNRSRSHLHKIRPSRIERSRGAPYVEAYSLWEDETRAFKIANIKAIRIADEEGDEGHP